MSSRLRADLSLLLVAVVWGSAFAVQRQVAQAGALFLFNGLRFLVAALALLPFTRRRLAQAVPGSWAALAAGTVLFISAALQQAGMRTTTAGNAGFLTGLYVVFVPLILWLGWRERPSRMAVLSIFLAGAGAYLLSTGGRSFQLHPGDDLELLGAVFWALHVVIVAKFARGLDVLAFSTAQFLVCGLLNMGIGLWTEPVDLPSLAGMTWAILYTGIISVGLGYTLQVWAQRHTPPVTAALLLSAEAVLAAFFGYVLLGEALSLLQALGALAILAGIALAQWKVVR